MLFDMDNKFEGGRFSLGLIVEKWCTCNEWLVMEKWMIVDELGEIVMGFIFE